MTKMGKDGDNKRISQTGDRPKEEIRSRMAEASAIVRSVFGSIQAVAGTTACKGVQIHALYKYAIEHGCWFYNLSELGVFSDRGSENEVYISYSGKWVYKLNDFRYADDNLLSFFERLEAHNLYFPDCAYDLVGFAHNQNEKVCAVLIQPFIVAKREATEEEISHVLHEMGFTSCLDGEYFTNGKYDLFDVLPNNVLMGVDGNLYFIDTIIYRSDADQENLKKYQSLSPRYKSEKFLH